MSRWRFPNALMTASVFLPLTLGAADGSLRIGIVGDQTGVDMAQVAENLQKSYQTLTSGIALLKSRNIRAVLHTGDLIEDTQASTADQYDEIFIRAARILDQAGVPWYLTPGDHDVNPPQDFTPNSTNRTYEGYFRHAYSTRQPSVQKALYYSFNVGSYHFISLNSLEHLRTDPRWGDVFLAELSDEQFQWLQADLKAHRKAAGIVVFMHQPLWYNTTAWPRVHRLLRQYRVKAVVAGHFHYGQDDGTLDGIRYVIVGATGGDVKQGNATAGNLQHVSVLTLRPRAPAEIEIVPIASAGGKTTLGSRPDMDRVQALDVMLDNNYYKGFDQFGPYNPLCVIDGNVYADAQKNPAVLKLLPLGNPLDVPVHATMTLTAPAWLLDGPAFRAGPNGCVLLADKSCSLAPGVGVYTSNNSSVTLPAPKDTTPLWQSGLRPASPPAIPTPITLELRVSFDGADGHYELYRFLRSTPSETCPVSAK